MKISIKDILIKAFMGKRLVGVYTTNYKGEQLKVTSFDQEPIITDVIVTCDYLQLCFGEDNHRFGYEETIEVKDDNYCMTCNSWNKETLCCEYTGCNDCDYTTDEKDGSGKKQCDGVCNPPDCIRGYAVNPKNWNPEYK